MDINNKKTNIKIQCSMLLIIIACASIYCIFTYVEPPKQLTPTIVYSSPVENFSDRLYIPEDLMIEINTHFFYNEPTGNESVITVYGTINNNTLSINQVNTSKEMIVTTNNTAVTFYLDLNAKMFIHNHPNYQCRLSNEDIKIAKRDNIYAAVYCYDKIAFYIPSLDSTYLYNLTERRIINGIQTNN